MFIISSRNNQHNLFIFISLIYLFVFFSYFFNRKLTLNNISLTAVEFSESVINGLILFFFSLFFMFLTPSDLLNHINNKTTFLDCQFFEIIMTFGSCLVDTVWFWFFEFCSDCIWFFIIPFEKKPRYDGGGFILHNGRLMMTQTSCSPLPHTYFDWSGPNTVLRSFRLLSRQLDRHEFNLYNALLVRMSTQNCRFRSQGTGICHHT